MPIKTHKIEMFFARSSKSVPMLDDPLIGHLQAIVLKKLDDLGKDAFGYKVLETLCLETRVFIDPSQIYSSMRKLATRIPALIEQVGEPRKSPQGGPPVKIFQLTAAGHAALKATCAHHRAVADFLENKK